MTPEAVEKTNKRARDAHILVVDDEPKLVAATARTLEAAGYEVSTATNGRSAYELLGTKSFDVIVSDIAMPELDGLRMLKLIRERDLDIPVILMTGSPGLESAIEGIAYGAFQYLVKPVLPNELLDVVRRAARLHQMARIKRDALRLVNEGGLGVSDRVGLEASFERALGTLWMAFQPIMQVSDRAVFGYEALLRTGEKALPNPGAILAAAERLGRLPDLGREIRAISAATMSASDDCHTLFLNLHPRDLLDEELFSMMSPLSAIASKVILEITERSSLDDIPDVRSRVTVLRRMGYRIAIDDLGAGYAGLTSFVALEPEVVKLDMSLVRDVANTPTKQKLIRSIAELCEDLGIAVVAEGVETVAERDVVIDLGCELLQGYLFARPDNAFAGSSAWA